ncbi:MAG: large conductance mechanosensitive channel protein MscL [Ruminococcus flavefaciens]|nr:large conductance mechanosensitive channel protein MscL [Ruminococcus flavefaciens]
MKKFLQEFKAFALKGNVMDLAIGVIIGAAFQDIVTSLTESFINPLINCIGGAEVAGKIKLGDTGQALNYGAFLTAVINFLIMAFVLFLLMKGINTIMHIGKKKEEEKQEEVVPEPSKEEVLLTEIRDLLKAQAQDVNADSQKEE